MADENNEKIDDLNDKEDKKENNNIVDNKNKEIKTMDTDNKNKEVQKDSSDEVNLVDRLRENPWMVISFILGILILIFFISDFTRGSGNAITGNMVSEEIAGEKLIDFAKMTVEGDVELINVSEFNEYLYEVSLSIAGQELSVFVTSDGKYLVSSLMPLEISDELIGSSSEENSQVDSQQEPDWSVFKNELEPEIKSKILSFNKENSLVYDDSLRIDVFENYDSIPNSLIVFYHSGCGWCTNYYPILVEAQTKYPDLNIYALVLSEYPEVASKYGVSGTPANIINGKYFVSGYRSLDDLSEILNKLQ